MKPNVIIINPDQMRADALGHLGLNEAAVTPVLDALAEEGVSFSQGFCANPVCVPSRCNFFTGLYPHTNGHRTMGYLMQPHEQNLFGDMKLGGYYTMSSTRGDLMAGQFAGYHKSLIDKYLLVKCGKRRVKHFAPKHGEPDSRGYYSFFDGIIPTKNQDDVAINMDDLTIDAAISAIKKRPKNKPFFMFVGLFFPHPPYQIEKRFYDLIDKSKLPKRLAFIGDDDGKPSMERGLRDGLRLWELSEAELDEIRAVYLAMVAKVDFMIGRLIEALKKEAIYDDTAVLVFSDHGDYTTDYGLVEKAQNCFPDCLVNVPFIVKPPKNVKIDAGINNNLVELTDVVATVAELTGVEIKRSHFSKSLLKTMQDKSVLHREFVCCEGGRLQNETHCSEFDQIKDKYDKYLPRLSLQGSPNAEHTKAVMLRTKRYKYIKRLDEMDEFYDLQIGESKNLIDQPQYVPVIQKMQQDLLDWYIKTCDVVPQKTDERFNKEMLWNNMTAMGIPRLVGRLLTTIIRLSGKTISQFLNMVSSAFNKRNKE